MLATNPKLDWRDVQGVIATSSRHINKSDKLWQRNGAGLYFSHKYGFGLIDAAAATHAARHWKRYEPTAVHDSGTLTVNAPLAPDDTIFATWSCKTSARVLHVEVTLDVHIPHRGDLQIDLVSPHNTTSRVSEWRSDRNADINKWTFVSVANWHESAKGKWALYLAMQRNAVPGVWKSWSVAVHTVK